MEDEIRRATIADKVGQLNDVELACLLCLVAAQHCIIKAEEDRLDEAVEDLEFACQNVFGLSLVTLGCTPETTLEEFGNGILIDDSYEAEERRFSNRSRISTDEHSFFRQSDGTRKTTSRSSYGFGDYAPAPPKKIADVVVIKNLHLANQQVQIQALELIRGKRIFTRTTVHAVPKRFLFVALLPDDVEAQLVPQLNDHIFISHTSLRLDEDDLDGQSIQPRWTKDADETSISSVVRTPSMRPPMSSRRSRASIRPSLDGPIILKDDIDTLMKLTARVRLSPEIRAYIHNIIVFMRMHRAVAGGASALATRHLLALSHALAPLHNLGYVTPSLVDLAVRKIYPHRLMLTLPEDERSMQWGSSLSAVTEMLDGITVEEIIEDVLQSVETPL